MGTVVARKEVTSVGRGRPVAARPSSLRLTLADLVTAIQDVVGPEDDRLVAATVHHLRGAGRLTGHGTEIHRVHRSGSGESEGRSHGADTHRTTAQTCGAGPTHAQLR